MIRFKPLFVVLATVVLFGHDCHGNFWNRLAETKVTNVRKQYAVKQAKRITLDGFYKVRYRKVN
jgi:hypothetical protein